MCAPCARGALRARRSALVYLQRRHDRARRALSDALASDAADRAARAHLASRRDRVRELRARNDRARRDAERERAHLDDARRRIRRRETSLVAARDAVARRRAELLDATLPDRIRAHTLALRAADASLAAERAVAVASLRTIMPIVAERSVERGIGIGLGSRTGTGTATATGVGSSPGTLGDVPTDAEPPPTAVRVCGFRVPDPRDAAGFRAEELAAGLGETLRLVHLAAAILAAPTVHRGESRGSSSRVWTPNTFWDDAPPVGETRLNLFLPPEIVEAAGGGARANPDAKNDRDAKNDPDANRSSSRSRGGAPRTLAEVGALVGKVAGGVAAAGTAAAATAANAAANAAGGASLRDAGERRVVGFVGRTSSSSSAPTRVDAAALARHRAELHRAVALMHRTVGVLCAEASHALGTSPPPGWGPLASLAFLIAATAKTAPPPKTSAPRSAPHSAPVPKASSRRRYRTWGARDVRESFASVGGVGASLMGSVFGVKPAARRERERDRDRDRDRDRGSASAIPEHEGRGDSCSSSSDDDPLDEEEEEDERSRAPRWATGTRVAAAADDEDEREWDFADVAPSASAGTRTRTVVDAPVVSLREMHAARGNQRDDGDGSGREKVRISDPGAKAKARDAARRSASARATVLPPPPSAPEDVEHWTRAMYVDARR